MSKKKIENQRVVTVTLSESQFGYLVGTIEKLAKAVAVAQIRDNQSTEQKAHVLRVFGLKGNEIADILGITEGRVSQILGVQKKTRGSRESSNDDAVGEA